MLDGLITLDGHILLWIQNTVRLSFLDPAVMFYTHLGDAGFLWAALSLVMLCFPKTRRTGLLALAALALGGLLTNVTLKQMVGRIRPWHTVDGLLFLVEELDPHSFPSGHTCAAFAAAGIWFRGLPWRCLRITGMAMAVLMGLSRLYVGVHFPSDVLAGALVGLLAAWLAWRLGRYLPDLGVRNDGKKKKRTSL